LKIQAGWSFGEGHRFYRCSPSFRISELPKPLAEREEESFRPIQVQGKPLSETIIEERYVK
jgi:hypothetical protein